MQSDDGWIARKRVGSKGGVLNVWRGMPERLVYVGGVRRTGCGIKVCSGVAVAGVGVRAGAGGHI